MSRPINFCSGPAALPLPVLEQIQAELLDFQGSGVSVMEHSHLQKKRIESLPISGVLSKIVILLSIYFAGSQRQRQEREDELTALQVGPSLAYEIRVHKIRVHLDKFPPVLALANQSRPDCIQMQMRHDC